LNAPPQRLAFGQIAELYDRVRPSYPPELVDELVALVGSDAYAVDAGCGTGKATVLLAERGLRGVGVEADHEMAKVAQRNLEPYPGWRVDVSDFEAWQPRPDDGTFDLITVAQAWHWIDHDRGAAQAERLLRPGGWLAIFAHEPEFEDSPLRVAIDEVYAGLAPEPSAQSRAPVEKIPTDAAFGPPVELEFRSVIEYTTQESIDLSRTHSDKLILPPERRELLLARLAETIDAHGGVYRHHDLCKLWAVQRL
jgi:SAM-dependent methyltransferase